MSPGNLSLVQNVRARVMPKTCLSVGTVLKKALSLAMTMKVRLKKLNLRKEMLSMQPSLSTSILTMMTLHRERASIEHLLVTEEINNRMV